MARDKYTQAVVLLSEGRTATFKAFGNSMLPLLKSGSTLTFKAQPEYDVGDIVFCKVRGRFIDAHKIVRKMSPGYMRPKYLIANNHGHENGWTSVVFGKVIEVA